MSNGGQRPGMVLRGEQQMLLQPRMLQSIEVLQLPSLALESWLREAAEANEALVVGEGPGPAPDGAGRRGTRADADAHDEMLRNQPERAPALADVVERQLLTCDLPEEVAEWARFLVGCVDESGFLSASDETLLALADEAGLEGGAAALGRAIAALQDLDPPGLGARNAIEALLLQLDPADPDYAALCRLLEEFVEELAKNRIPGVARAMGLEIADLERLLQVLGELHLRPLAHLTTSSAPVITPDVVVLPTADGYEVEVLSSALPAVGLDADVAALAKDKEQPRDVRRYLRGRLDSARAIVEAVEQRGRTLLRVARAIFRHQRAFLEGGPSSLAPLRMTALADELEIHVSTVSRTVAGKYAQTPWGIFPLRGFFQAAGGGDESRARSGVGGILAEVVAGEDASRPFSDDDLVAELARRGVEVARRTVAKYRKEQGIPSSYRRRRFDG